MDRTRLLPAWNGRARRRMGAEKNAQVPLCDWGVLNGQTRENLQGIGKGAGRGLSFAHNLSMGGHPSVPGEKG